MVNQYLLHQSREHVKSGNEEKLRLLLSTCSQDERHKLITTTEAEAAVVRRPSNSLEFHIEHPNLLLSALSSWFNDITACLAAFSIGIDDDVGVYDPTNDPVRYTTKPIIIASMLGKVDMVNSLLKNGAHVDSTNSLGDTSLLEACFEGNYTVTDFLLQKGAAVNKQNERGITALMLAAYAGNEEVVDLLLKRGANPHMEDLRGRNALFYCVSAGHVCMFEKLLDKGVQIDPDMDGMTLLMEAAYEGHVTMVKHLVAHAVDLRIDIHCQDKAKRNALFYAFENSKLEIVKYLVSQGAELRPSEHNKSVLMCACLKNNVEVVEFCLRNADMLGLCLDDVDNKGRNTLFYAVTGGNVHILQRLLEANMPVSVSPDGINLLMQAAGKKQLDMGRYILHHKEEIGVDLNTRDKDGWTALLYSVSARNHEFCKMLILEGAVSMPANDGKTVIMQAAQNGDLEMLRYLCDKSTMISLDINATDNEGWSCLYYCLLGGSIDCMQYMMQQGLKSTENRHQTTLLMEAIDRGDMDFVKFLVENSADLGLDLNAKDSSGCNPLFYCSANGSTKIFEYLVNNQVKLCDDNHNRTVLMQAAYNAHRELVTYLIDNEISLGLDVNQKDKDGRNVLFYCIEGGNLDMLIMLLEYGIPMQPDYNGKNNLFQAVAAGHTAIVEYILNNRDNHLKLDPLATDCNSNNAMYYYAKRPNNKSILSMLLSVGLKISDCSNASNILAQALKSGDLITAKMITGAFDKNSKKEMRTILQNWKSERGETLFHWVAMKNDEEFFRLLAPYYDPEIDKDDHNRTPLISACAQKESDSNASLIKCMLNDVGIDVNAADIHKHTPLWYAVCSQNTTAVQLLLQFGAKNVIDNYDCSVLMTAAKVGNIINAQYLLNLLPGAYALLGHHDRYNRNVLHYAAMSGSSEVASLYMRWCPQLMDSMDENECTPLMIAAAWGHTQTVANIIRHGANVNTTDGKLRSALHYCVDQSSPSLTTIHLLSAKGHIDINAKDNRGQTALMIAARRGNLLVAKCLLSHGADSIACDYEGLEPLDYCKRGDYQMKKLINRFADMPLLERKCLEVGREEYREIIDVTRIMDMLQREHIITPQLEAIVLADPSFSGRVDRLLDIIMARGPKAFGVFTDALREFYPVLAHELKKLHYIQTQRELRG